MKKTNKKKSAGTIRQTIFPPPVLKGETIGLVAPAGPIINRENFAAGLQILEKKGFKVKFNRKHLHAAGYLAGSDQERAETFNRLWADPEVKAVMAIRGGYGCLRMIDLVNMRQIRKNPKPLIGFSDITVLLNAIHKKTGLITYHGPVVTTLSSIDRNSLAVFFDMLGGKTRDIIKPSGIKILQEGTAKGVLQGGNLATLAHMTGTPYEPPWKDIILFMEDISESPYRLDRILTHLTRARRLQKVKGLILGTFTDENRKENSAMQKAVRNRTLELLGDAGIPIWANFPVGHSRRNLTLPIGAMAVMDSSAGKLYL